MLFILFFCFCTLASFINCVLAYIKALPLSLPENNFPKKFNAISIFGVIFNSNRFSANENIFAIRVCSLFPFFSKPIFELFKNHTQLCTQFWHQSILLAPHIFHLIPQSALSNGIATNSWILCGKWTIEANNTAHYTYSTNRMSNIIGTATLSTPACINRMQNSR